MAVEIEIHKKIGKFSLDLSFQSNSRRIGILGESGCGKSMTLRSIAGVEQMDSGKIVIDGKVVYDSAQKINLKPQKRNIGYLFQNYALFPTMSVKANIAVGLKGTKAEKEARVQEMIEKFQLTGLENQLPSELSGGQQQRVALARIMAYRPDMILLDEPFSAMDMFLKDRLQQELMELLEDYEGVVILVSHSRDEIYRFSEELLVMHAGRKICLGNVKDVFAEPRWREAARLTGCKNLTGIRRIDEHRIEVPDWGIELTLKGTIPEEITSIGVRAHEFIPIWGTEGENCIPVILKSMANLPFERKYFLKSQKEAEDICWFIQRELWKVVDEKGMPDYLQIPESTVLLLK